MDNPERAKGLRDLTKAELIAEVSRLGQKISILSDKLQAAESKISIHSIPERSLIVSATREDERKRCIHIAEGARWSRWAVDALKRAPI